jgi:hypothetical protein
MESLDSLDFGEVVLRLPGGFGITFPFDKILQPPADAATIENLLHFPFLFSVDDDWQGRWQDLAWEGIIGGKVKQGDGEHSVLAYCVGNVQFVSVGSHKAGDTIRAMVLILQFPTRSFRSPVSPINPYHISWLEGGSRTPMVVGVVLVAKLGKSHFAACDIMDGGEALGCRLSLLFLREIDTNVQFEVVLGVEPMVREERRDTGGIRDLVIAGEFSEEEVVCPIVLKVADVRPKVLFHDCVHALSLSIGFRVEGRREAGVDLQTVA